MTKEQLIGLAYGDTVWIKGWISLKREDYTRIGFPQGGYINFDEDQLIHAVELELPRPYAPEGYEEFEPVGKKDLTVGMLVGATSIRSLEGITAIWLEKAACGVTFEALEALGVPFYRPIKKEPEEVETVVMKAPVGCAMNAADGNGIIYLPPNWVGEEVVVMRKARQGGAL